MDVFRVVLLIASLGVTPACAQDLPASAKKATLEEFKALADGKSVKVEILDFEKPITATLVWSWADMTITGDALVDGKDKVEVNTKLSFEGEKACGENDGAATCHLIYIEGNRFYEVRDDGAVHAVSEVQN